MKTTRSCSQWPCFYYHIRIVRWGEPDPDVDYIARYLPDLREAALRYAGFVDLDQHLPSLGRAAAKMTFLAGRKKGAASVPPGFGPFGPSPNRFSVRGH